jgi:hypothetical protein
MAAQTLGTFSVNVNTIDPGSNLTGSLPITINPSLLSNYTMGGMSANEVNISPDGTLQLSGDLWTKLDFGYNVTQYTVLEFQFRSDAMGFAHVIGFDNDNSYWDNANSNKLTGFKLFGTQTWDRWNQSLNNYSGTDWKSYSFKIGDLFTGAMNYLFFVNTNPNGTLGNSFFRNIRVYDINSLDIAAPTAGVSIANSTVKNGTTFVNANSEYQFTVTYTDASGINLATLDNNDIKVLAPNGTLQNATLVTTTSSSDRKTVTATYKIFDVGIIGGYSIFLQENQVSDINYNFLASQSLGLFTVGTPYTTIESVGNTKFLKDSTNKYFAQVGTATPITIKSNGTQISKDFFGTNWQTLAVETVNGKNQILWKNVTGNFLHLWHMDSNWNRVSSGGQWALNSAEAFNIETIFGVDVNGDGVIGKKVA